MEHDEHAAVQALLPSYAREQLRDDEAGQVQRHLLQCPACRDELAADQPMHALLTVACTPSAGGGVETRMVRIHALMRPSRPQSAAPRWMPWALGLQGAACVLLLAL